ncbi:MAG: 5-formyltetrahydrofolate cyclo-ligase [Zetaproteobacteria bacterium]|nr:5-formyltetrahydrofolate cyclo-ligase [Zetaproteobacteria bacterium]
MKNDKHSIRIQMRHQRQKLSHQLRAHHSNQIIDYALKYVSQHGGQDAAILCYYPLPEEVCTKKIFADAASLNLYAPAIVDNDMLWLHIDTQTQWQQHDHKFYQPIEGSPWSAASHRKNFLFAPLVAFDRTGHRLGMGKGFFDRWLAQHQHEMNGLIGLAFSFQEINTIPHEPHDIPMHLIITEQGVLHAIEH